MSDAVAVAAGAVAALLLAGAALWRGRVRHRARQALATALHSLDPATRLSALAAVGSQGILPHADALLRCAAEERDPRVVEALARVIARNQWEPADDPRIVELRVWAQQHIGTAPGDPARVPVPGPRPAPPARTLHWSARTPIGGEHLAAAVEAALGERVRSLRLVVAGVTTAYPDDPAGLPPRRGTGW